MSKWKIYTPEGVQDILFDECFAKRNIEQKIRELFRLWGYFEIETPTVEFYDTFSAESDLTPQETMFKFFDQQGRILVLRPEATIPVARIVATKLKDAKYPLKFFYIGNMFRYNEFGGGKQKEFTQAGLELIGLNTPESDAEVIALAIKALKTAGLREFQIDIGQVEFFKGIMEETGLPEQEVERIRVLIDRKDYLAIEELVEKYGISENLKKLILGLPKLFGSTDLIDSVEKITMNSRSLKALENLRRVLQILDDYNLEKYISIDLGMVQSLNYYTGIIFRGFTHGIGFPVLSGGRYDNLVEKFGKKCSATGFSLGINMVMMALDRQNITFKTPSVESLVCYTDKGRKNAFELCEALRSQGIVTEANILGEGIEKAKEYAKDKGIGGIIYALGDGKIEVHNLETGEIIETDMDRLSY
ncbi:MAG TPA: ATP phosphoribosyltransferase regulatory subunit [Clostridiaceae bacterium]|nr:ATP phosphoribosyltransferase regulatory subunit [Clostridiaceae bacterium]